MLRWLSSRAARRILLGGVCCCFLSGSEFAPCTSPSTVVQLTVDSAEAASTAVQAVSCTGGVFSVEWVGNITLPSAFNISGGTVLRVYGGGGTTGSLASEENVIYGALATQLFSLSDAELNLEGVTMMGGFAQPEDGYFSSETTFGSNIGTGPGGGAITAADSVVTMTDCVATGNFADNGGAVFLWQSHLVLFGVTSFTNNNADSDGGAIYAIRNSTITVEGETSFLYNEGSRFWDSGSGGAIDINLASNLTILGKATFHGNAAGIGGALHWWINSFVNVTGEVEFTENDAVTGGAISCSGKEERVNHLNLGGRANFFNNTAKSAGALHMGGSGDVSITGDVNFTENVAENEGGAIVMTTAGFLSFEESAIVRFTSNKGGASGGGIAMWGSEGLYLNSGDATVSFVENSAGDSGGAIYASKVNILSAGGSGRLLFVGNSATNSGGAVHVAVATRLSMSNGVEFRGNFARVGGAVVVESASGGSSTSSGGLRLDSATITECGFFSNAADEDGGALHIASGFMIVTDSTFEGNTAGRSAGALSVSGTLTTFENCTFYENSAPSGPAVFNIGTISDQTPMDLEFSSNSIACDDGQFIDYVDPVLGDDTAANANASTERYMVDCEGCPSWYTCTNCLVLGDIREPACAVTPDHTTSLDTLGTLETLELEPGYWRATDISKTILSCYNKDACEGGASVTGYCSTGYEGPYCSVCEEGYAPGLSFSCNSCSDGRSLVAIAVALIVVGVVVVVAILLDLTAVVATASSTNRNCCGAGYRRLKAIIPFQSLKIVVVSWQIITQFSEMANAFYPDSYERFLSIVSLSNLNLARFLSAGCLVSTDFYDRLFISTLGPIALLLVLAGTYTVATWRNRDLGGGSRAAIIQKHASIVLLVAFLVYGSVSSTVFGMFACEDLEDGGHYLRVDYRIRCDTDKHRMLQGYAAFMIILYPIGIPVFFAGLLLSHRGALVDRSSGRDDNSTIKPFADLWQPYRPEMYMFELLEYLRRILLTGIVVFIFPNTAAQIAVTFIMELFFFVVSVFLLPYAKRFDAWLSHVGHVVVMVTLYLALLLKVDISDETDDSQEVFAGVLVAVHLLMILSVTAEAVLLVCEKVGTPLGTGGDDGRGSPISEVEHPLPKSSRYVGRERNKEDTAPEENMRWAETVETTPAEFQSQRRQVGQAEPVSSMSSLQGARSEKQPLPSFDEQRRPPAPPYAQQTGQEYPSPPQYVSRRNLGGETRAD